MNPPVKKGDRIVALYVSMFPELQGNLATVVEVGSGQQSGRIYAEFPGYGGALWVDCWELAPEPEPEPEPYTPAEGDRVRLRGTELVGVIRRGPFSDGTFLIDFGNGETAWVLPHRLERLPEPETPEWWPPQPGDVIKSSGGFTYLRANSQWVSERQGFYDDDAIGAPHTLTLLVRDGKPVGGAS